MVVLTPALEKAVIRIKLMVALLEKKLCPIVNAFELLNYFRYKFCHRALPFDR
jgi:hypothetical protein